MTTVDRLLDRILTDYYAQSIRALRSTTQQRTERA